MRGLLRISAQAFDCTSLSSITLPSIVTFIGSSAFDSCKKLDEVVNGKRDANITHYGESDANTQPVNTFS